MISPDPDMTRLLDRMETRGLIRRERSSQDRRVVVTWIAQDGLDLVGSIDEPLQAAFRQTLGRMGQRRLADLIEILEALREAP
jgi:DNA-binding MarR family transcriptional regulator